MLSIEARSCFPTVWGSAPLGVTLTWMVMTAVLSKQWLLPGPGGHCGSREMCQGIPSLEESLVGTLPFPLQFLQKVSVHTSWGRRSTLSYTLFSRLGPTVQRPSL